MLLALFIIFVALPIGFSVLWAIFHTIAAAGLLLRAIEAQGGKQ